MNLDQFIESGIIQAYVLGIATEEESAEVQKMASQHPQVQEAINIFGASVEKQARTNATKPPPIVKTNVMASLDFMYRMMKGELSDFPPRLTESSKIEDYAKWLNREDMVVSESFEGIFAKVIGYTPEMTTAIAWMHEMYTETHTNEIERFLVVEGSCEVTIDEKVYHLLPGDFMTIPPGKVHRAVSTSASPCKVILQKLAA